ncbi:Ig-like domain-containing protein, partial [Celeribacter sp.]|uniref:Ig-like domain-containing protein n=1 Tax=Celeribacter sp. TaxID=1890673 RepID=UPI003A8FDEAD
AATQKSFTVTVSDNQAPVITPPANQNLTTTTDKTSFDVTSLGSASDNVDGAVAIVYKVGSIVLTGAYDFPLGATVVTMDAVDGAGNSATQQSFTVTVSDVTPPVQPAGITLVTNADSSITVSGSGETQANVEVTFPDGSVVTQPLGSSGTFSVTSAPSQPTGTVKVVVIDLAGNRSPAFTSTVIIAVATVEETQREIAGFIQARAGHVIGAQPGYAGFLSGAPGRFNAQVTRGKGQFEFASSANQPLWAKAQGSWSKSGTLENSYFFGAFGGHVNLNPNAIVGLVLEVDKITQTHGATKTKGQGYLVGPYFAAKLPDHPLFFEGSYLAGQTENTFQAEGAAKQQFDTHRTYANLKVSGQLNYGKTTLTPSLSAKRYEDTQLAFTDSANRLIPEQGIEVSDVEMGIDFQTPLYLERGTLILNGGLSGIWSETKGSGFASSVASAYEGGRGRTHLGAVYAIDENVNISTSAFYDGIGQSDYKSWGIEFSIDMKF